MSKELTREQKLELLREWENALVGFHKGISNIPGSARDAHIIMLYQMSKSYTKAMSAILGDKHGLTSNYIYSVLSRDNSDYGVALYGISGEISGPEKLLDAIEAGL